MNERRYTHYVSLAEGHQEAVEGTGDDVVWLAQDVRSTGKGGQGTGGRRL